jgi:hypothetical protein
MAEARLSLEERKTIAILIQFSLSEHFADRMAF